LTYSLVFEDVHVRSGVVHLVFWECSKMFTLLMITISFTSIQFEYGKIGYIAVYPACADPYSSEIGPEYLAFRAVIIIECLA